MPLMPVASPVTTSMKSSRSFHHLREEDILSAHLFCSSMSETAFGYVLIQMFKLHIRGNFYFICSTSQNERISIRENKEASVSDTTSLKRKHFLSRQTLLAEYSHRSKITPTKNFYVISLLPGLKLWNLYFL